MKMVLDSNIGIMDNVFEYIMFIMLVNFLIIGICLILLPKKYFDRKRRKCNVQVEAKVIELKQREKESEKGINTYKLYSPTYEFYYNNIEYKVNLESYGNYGIPSIGDEILIKINPKNPEEIYIPNMLGEKIIRGILLVIGIGCIFLSSMIVLFKFFGR